MPVDQQSISSSCANSAVDGATPSATREVYEKFWKHWCSDRFDENHSASNSAPRHLLLDDLFLSPVGLGTHYMDSSEESRNAIRLALKSGINVIDMAPNYGGDGSVESAVGAVVKEFEMTQNNTSPDQSQIQRREAIVLVSKVGNVVGKIAIGRCKALLTQQQNEIKLAFTHDMVHISGSETDGIWHCLHPKWIDEQVTGILGRLQVSSLDVLLLHNPETQLQRWGYYHADSSRKDGNIRSTASKVEKNSFSSLSREEMKSYFNNTVLKNAFKELENQRLRGRIQFYGVSGAFYPLRESAPQHLVLDDVMHVALEAAQEVRHSEDAQSCGLRVIQFPFNFAEPDAILQSQVERKPNGALCKDTYSISLDADPPILPTFLNTEETLVEKARRHNLYVLSNRPLNGAYKECTGIARFSSTLPFNSVLQEEDVDALESKLGKYMECPAIPDAAGDDDDYADDAGDDDADDDFDPNVTGQLAGKSVLTISSLQMGTVLAGLRRPAYLQDMWRVFFNEKFRFRVGTNLKEGSERDGSDSATIASVARSAVQDLHMSVGMWLQMMACEGDDRGTAKDWRLPIKSGENAVAEKSKL